MDPQRSGPNQGQALEDPSNKIRHFHEFCDEFQRQVLRNPNEMLTSEYVLSLVSYARHIVDGLINGPQIQGYPITTLSNSQPTSATTHAHASQGIVSFKAWDSWLADLTRVIQILRRTLRTFLLLKT
ncbi:hypothetical protein N7488_010630 [Penicillium malachiteum]|nr:hypothetical protein N7488_010630 [Penicillium malachiteum]